MGFVEECDKKAAEEKKEKPINPFKNPISDYNAIDKAWKKEVSYDIKSSAEQKSWDNILKIYEKDGTIDLQRLHQFILAEFDESKKDQIYKSAERFKQLADKGRAERHKAEEKEFDNKIKKASQSFTKDYVDFAEEFFAIQPFYYDDVCVWWLWDSKVSFWHIIDETTLLNEIYEACKENGIKITSSSVKSEITTAMKMVGRRHKPKEAKKKWIQFKDKAFSLTSGEEYKVTPEYFFTNPIPWEIGESLDTPVLDKLFEEWVGKKYLPTLYEILAYCCYSDYPIQVLFCFYGGGRNGKTCFLKVLSKFIGVNNLCSTDLDLLVGHNKSRFEVFKLYKKLACLMGETNFGVLDNSSVLKKLTGGDLIGFEIKGKSPFDDYNYAKVLIASNSLPSSEDTSEGFYRRWVIIDFPNQFKEGKDITKTIPDVEYSNLANKCCKILPELLEKGEFTNQGTIEQRKAKYIMASNPLPFFIKEYCNANVYGYIRYSELYLAYTKFLGENKKRIVSKKEFSKILIQEGLENRKTSKDGIVDYYVEGLEFSKDLLDLPDFRKSQLNPLTRKINIGNLEIREMGEIIEESVVEDIEKAAEMEFETFKKNKLL